MSIRHKINDFGDANQIWSYGGKACALSKEVLYEQFGVECLQKLDDGMSERAVHEWVRSNTK